MKPTEFIWQDGKLVPWADATAHPMSLGLNYGAGVFEGLRSYGTDHGSAVFAVESHLRRLRESAGLHCIDIPFTDSELRDATLDVVRVNGLRECYVRPVAWLGVGDPVPGGAPVHVAIGCWNWTPATRDSGSKLGISSYPAPRVAGVPPAAKATGQYGLALLARYEAHAGGYDDALMLNESGHITEATAANMFLVRGDDLITPPLEVGCLAGITRGLILELVRQDGGTVIERPVLRSDVFSASEVFLAGTLTEIAWVESVSGRAITPSPGPRTSRLSLAFSDVVHGRDARFAHLITDVTPVTAIAQPVA